MVAGSLQFAVFNSEAFYDMLYGTQIDHLATYARKVTEIQLPGAEFNSQPTWKGSRNDIIGAGGSSTSAGQNPSVMYGTTSNPYPYGTSSFENGNTYEVTGVGVSNTNVAEIGIAEAACDFADQIMPMDISIIGLNEYAQQTVSRIYGVELLNMGLAISIDDIDMSETYTYLAITYRGFQPLYYSNEEDIPLNRYLSFGSLGGIPGDINGIIPNAPFVPVSSSSSLRNSSINGGLNDTSNPTGTIKSSNEATNPSNTYKNSFTPNYTSEIG